MEKLQKFQLAGKKNTRKLQLVLFRKLKILWKALWNWRREKRFCLSMVLELGRIYRRCVHPEKGLVVEENPLDHWHIGVFTTRLRELSSLEEKPGELLKWIFLILVILIFWNLFNRREEKKKNCIF